MHYELTVDHIVPEVFLDKPDEWVKYLKECPIESSFMDFSINDYGNWVPAHESCNYRKGNEPFPPAATIFYLALAKRRLARIKIELDSFDKSRKKKKVLDDLASYYDSGVVSKEEISLVLETIEYRHYSREPVVITYGLRIQDAIEQRVLGEELLSRHWYLCDWLENELMNHLKSLSSYAFHYTEPSLRNGESLSVRLVFPEVSRDEVDKLSLHHFSLPCWDLLEMETFYNIYNVSYREAFLEET